MVQFGINLLIIIIIILYHAQSQVPTVIWFCETYMFFALSFIPASFILNVSLSYSSYLDQQTLHLRSYTTLCM